MNEIITHPQPTLETYAARLAASAAFLARWKDAYGSQPVETRHVHRLPGCPFGKAHGAILVNRQRLAQALRLLADDGRDIRVGTANVGRIERAERVDDEVYPRRRWRLIVAPEPAAADARSEAKT